MEGSPRVLETQETPSEDESEFDYGSQDAQSVKDDFIEYKEYLNRHHTNSGSFIENELSPEISDGNDSVNEKVYNEKMLSPTVLMLSPTCTAATLRNTEQPLQY